MGFGKVCVLVLAVTSLTLAYPAGEDAKSDVEIISVNKQRPQIPSFFEVGDDEDDVFDAGEVGFFPFRPFFGSIGSLVNRWYSQMADMWGSIPTKSNSSFIAFPGIPNIDDIDLSKGNTTSVVKVINGHKVEINETEFKKDSEHGESYYKVRLINVLPDGEASISSTPEFAPTEGGQASTPRDVEPLENSKENEIGSHEGSRYGGIETFDEPDGFAASRETEWNEWHSAEPFGDNNLDYNVQEFRDLSDDIYVNRVLADRGQPINPDAEYVDVQNVEKFS